MEEDKNQSDKIANENSEEKTANETTEQNDLIQKLEDEVNKLKDAILRQAAESENLRKRLEKEKEDGIKYSNAKFAKDLLTILDNFERIYENSAGVKEKIKSDPNLKALFDGISLCEKEWISIFKKHGVAKIEVGEGDVFNPEYHQAMCELDSPNHKVGSIIKVFQAGYTHHSRLLRPAMVSVSKKA
ncbi:MAG: nucleotide exchange factor GrpE [Holosporaceae bacterium]|jgi:molecular chaperone GrpE|nr:nucleotide exchange factor GrpE [Holosporaceae bacterium]